MIRNKGLRQFFYMVSLICVFAGCTNAVPLDTRSEDQKINDPFYDNSKRETIFGEGGLNLFSNKNDNSKNGSGIAVNSFLWRATLEQISNMPINSVDPFGGVIITDWYSFPISPNERFKLNVYILGKTLRADGIKVSSFRQVLGSDRVWRDAVVPEAANVKIEDSILTQARKIRNQSIIPNKN
jgi:hypothetical protein